MHVEVKLASAAALFMFNDSNHRFTTSMAAVSALEGQGWRYEGVAFCAAG